PSYRFRGRPWEIQNIPTVCGECPIGCNTYATIREGQVVCVLSRNNPAVDDGWLCDRGRYTFPRLESEQRITTPLIRGGRGLEPVDGSTALDHIADRLRAAVERFGPGSVAIVAGATRLDTLHPAEHISAAPGTTHAALLAAFQGVALKGLSDRSVILWNGRMSAPVAAVLAHVAHTSGCRVLPTPLAANELGC